MREGAVRSGGGFSLLEAMVAMAILAFGLLGATAGQIMAMKLTSTSRSHTLAMDLAEQQLEVFQADTGANVKALITGPGFLDDANNPIDPDPGDGSDMQFARRWLIQPDSPEAGVIMLTIEVDWTNALGNVRTARVQSLKADL
jgi:Tfp pilus assembly protein PilV